jgi:hypothetical protein
LKTACNKASTAPETRVQSAASHGRGETLAGSNTL